VRSVFSPKTLHKNHNTPPAAALLFVGGGAFALSSVDAGFAEFMRTAAVKDSSEDGAGYEEVRGRRHAARA
jgi:acetyl esterase/lipase